MKQHKIIKAVIKSVDQAKATLDAVFSTSDEDRHGDVVEQNWDLKAYKKNPVLLNSHQSRDATETIGKVQPISVKDGKLQGRVHFAVNENPKAKVIFDLYAGGFLSGFSVGFIPKEFDDKNPFRIKKSELLEISAVAVPANALSLAKQKGIDVEPLEDEPADEDIEKIENNSPPSDGGIENINPDDDEKGWDDMDESEKKELAIEFIKQNEIQTKDVAEAVALADLIGFLDFLIFAFNENEVSERTVAKMKEALSLLMKALKEQSKEGKKSVSIKPLSQKEKAKMAINRINAERKKRVMAINNIVDELRELKSVQMSAEQKKIEKKKLNQAVRNLIDIKSNDKRNN